MHTFVELKKQVEIILLCIICCFVTNLIKNKYAANIKYAQVDQFLYEFLHPEANWATFAAVNSEISNPLGVSKCEGFLMCLPVDVLDKSIFNFCICNDGCPLLTS